MILEGTFGKISDEANVAVEKLFKSSEKIVALVEEALLNINSVSSIITLIRASPV